MVPLFQGVPLVLRWYSIRGHKDQNSTGTWCHGFLVLESWCRGSLVLESWCHGFLSSEKTLWNHDLVAYLSPFYDVVVFYRRISMSWFFGLGISMLWFFGIGIPMSWYMCLHGLVFVIIVKTKISRIIMSIILLKNISIAQIYATTICIMYA